LVDGYNPSANEQGRSRVLLAAVRLSGGDLEKLESAQRAAASDFRDVVASAEYEAPSSPLS